MAVLRTLLCALVVLLVARPVVAEEPARKGLPRLGSPETAEEIRGVIADTTRGQRGPVRLVVRVTGGSELAVLVAPDKVCESLGLSLKTGEDVTLTGRMITTGERPLFVAETVELDGKPVSLRDPGGGWVKAAGGEAVAAEEGQTAESAPDAPTEPESGGPAPE